MRPETGEAVLASTPQLRPGGARLSSLVGRVAESRGLTLVDGPAPSPPAPPSTTPAPALSLALSSPARRGEAPVLSLPAVGLVTAPPAGRSRDTAADPVDGVALLGAHGGAGVTSLLRAGLDQVAVDAGRRWPRAGLVLLVARTSTSGLEWARDLARQHASGLAGDVELLGLVLVPDAPGRLPARTAGLRDLVSGAFARTWQLPWLEEWRLAATTEPLPAHPDVQHLVAELTCIPQLSHLDLSRINRTRGDLL
jgi:hypothetical protein